MSIRKLEPGAAWNEAERRSYPLGFVAFFIAGLCSAFGYNHLLSEPALAAVCGGVGGFGGALATCLGFYNRKWKFMLFTVPFIVGAPTVVTAFLIPVVGNGGLALVPCLLVGLASYLFVNSWHRALSNVATTKYVSQVVSDPSDSLTSHLDRRLVWALIGLGSVLAIAVLHRLTN